MKWLLVILALVVLTTISYSDDIYFKGKGGVFQNVQVLDTVDVSGESGTTKYLLIQTSFGVKKYPLSTIDRIGFRPVDKSKESEYVAYERIQQPTYTTNAWGEQTISKPKSRAAYIILSYAGISVNSSTLNGGSLTILSFDLDRNYFLGGGLIYQEKSWSYEGTYANASATLSRFSIFGSIGFGGSVYAGMDVGFSMFKADVRVSSYSAEGSETYFMFAPKVGFAVPYFSGNLGYVINASNSDMDGVTFSIGIAIPL